MLTSKQRSFLRSMANTYEPLVQIGKGSLTAPVATAVSEALEARELIKVRVLKNNDDDIRTLAAELAQQVGADVVQVIGRNFVLYRRRKEKPVIELPE
jgi:RNA-binding protein